MNPLRLITLALPLCATTFTVTPSHAQSQLSALIDRCARGDMGACSAANQAAIQRRQQQFSTNMPGPGNGLYVPCVARSVCGTVGGNALPGNWSWTHQLFGGIRRNHPQAWYPSFPGTYGRGF
jgi:hypothetical protein